MRSRLAVVLACLTATAALLPALLLVPADAGVAAGPLTGRLRDVTGSNPPVVGATVRLRTVTASGPGVVVATTATDAEGDFSLDAGAAPDDEYYVQVLAGRYQGGYVGGSPAFVQRTVGDAATYGPHATLGTVLANPAFIRGVAVDRITGRPLAGVRATARSANDLSEVEGADTSDRHGVFLITGLTCEDDCYLKLNGAPRHEIGFRSCSGGVVPTWGDACGAPLGRIGRVRLDRS